MTRLEAPRSATAALELVGIHKSYGSINALKTINLSVHDNELVTLLGPSGSGKSTILGIAAGIVIPDAGQIKFRGVDVTDRAPHARGVGMVFQRYTLFPNKTVAENVAFPLLVRKFGARERVERVEHFLELIGLSSLSERYPSQLSGGQAQRVALARALVFEPILLLMDEPLGALDRRLRLSLQEQIRQIQQKTKIPTLYVTHDQEEAMNLSDRIAILRDGQIVSLGPPRQIYSNPTSLWAAEFIGDANSDRIARWESCETGHFVAITRSGLRFRAQKPTTYASGKFHCIVVRPEDCIVSNSPLTGTACYRGEVFETSYLGSVQRLRIRLEKAWTISAVIHARVGEFSPGSTVFCGWSDDAVSIVAEE